MNKDLLRQLPSVDSLLKAEGLIDQIDKYGRESVVDAARKAIEGLR